MSDDAVAAALAVIARVRRAMPRNGDVMLVCDVAERALVKPVAVAAEAPKPKVAGKADRKAYMRDYMRKRREAKRGD